jgi:murein DD-endopeptidase MepM/ murein hydrolase activator NlpD
LKLLALAVIFGGSLLGLVLSTSSFPDEEVAPDHAANLENPKDNIPVPTVIKDDSGSPPSLQVGVSFKEMKIGRGEYFYDAMRKAGSGHSAIMSLVKACKPYRNLKNVRKGDVFLVAIDENNVLHQFKFDLEDQESYLLFQRDDNGIYNPFELTYPVEHITTAVSGTVSISIFESLIELDAPSVLAAKMNDLLGWDIDFRTDVRKGDTFKIIYEAIQREGKPIRTGPIIAVEFTNRGKLYTGFRFECENGKASYFNQDGESLEKQLMRAPLSYSRISSSFSHRRLHPVHKRYMPHLGIDYAAPVGTAVYAAGSGTIYAANRNKHNGKYVKIRHSNSSYETFYLHLSRFAKGIRKGKKVTQGQVIGYVGATGVATGPHLDYRVKKDGQFVNPRSLKLPAADPVAKEKLDKFKAQMMLYCYCLANIKDKSEPHQIELLPLQTTSSRDLPLNIAFLK